MFPVVIPNSVSAVVPSSLTSPSRSHTPDIPNDPVNFFLKDGRKISIGDCALFKSPKDSPPFIGLIRGLTTAKEGNINLSVNWLYRPSDLELGKGVLLDAAPNEIFYSFHKDIISAGSLLHPCKVAFLHKGAALLTGTLSFICRRVYDIENKCLWWLTDKDYVNERQEEVDKLLKKTTLEMQSGGRSPKPLNPPTSTSQLKSSLDGKSKKRERNDVVSDSSKKERLHKTENAEVGQVKTDPMLKSEIAKITEKGGLVDFGGVEKFVKLMQCDDAEKKIDLAGRLILAEVISATDRFDCLGWFVQLKGLSIMDEWLQEVHKKKIVESESSSEDFLLGLLKALDKLPVNLHALQTCNVGKSVNHLRTHKNGEISKKARILVDTWKKRVEEEMNMNEMKIAQSRGVTWPNKVGTLENSDNKRLAKVSLVKNEDGSGKIPAKCLNSPKVGSSELPLTPIKDERTTSSSQSQSNSQSCSGEQKTTVNSCKEDARSSTGKSSNTVSRHRKPNAGFHTPKENSSVKNVTADVPPSDHGCNQRLIVKLPSTPKAAANVGTCEDSLNKVCEKRVKTKSNSLVEDGDGDDGEEGEKGIEEPKGTEAYDASLSSMNALVESCVKISEATSPEDEGAMNLLASVAAGEIVKSDNVSSSSSPQKNSPVPDEACSINGEDKAVSVREEIGSAKEDIVAQCTEPSMPEKREESSHVLNEVDEAANKDETAEKIVESCPSATAEAKVENELTVPCKVDDAQPSPVADDCPKPNEESTKDTHQAGEKEFANEKELREETPNKVSIEESGSSDGPPSTSAVKLDFDLNEGIPCEDADFPKTSVNIPSNPVTIAAAAKGGFVPPENPLKGKEIGWKGSAATSAFRPTGPNRRLLDFDLNVADEPEDAAPSSSRLDLDLNKIEDHNNGESTNFKTTSRVDLGRSRDFDLNNGPGVDEVASDVASRIHPAREFGNYQSWFPPTNSYPNLSMIPQRNDQSFIANQRILPPTSFGLEMYRGPVLASSPFPYSGFPFETSFAQSSSSFGGGSVYGDSSAGGAICFPNIPSQIVGPSGVITAPYPRPFIMSIPGVGGDVRKWGGAIDLNSGPGVDDRLPGAGRVHPTADDQLKRYHEVGGGMGVFKRKEPEGGWDSTDRFSYKQASWQ